MVKLEDTALQVQANLILKVCWIQGMDSSEWIKAGRGCFTSSPHFYRRTRRGHQSFTLSCGNKRRELFLPWHLLHAQCPLSLSVFCTHSLFFTHSLWTLIWLWLETELKREEGEGVSFLLQGKWGEVRSHGHAVHSGRSECESINLALVRSACWNMNYCTDKNRRARRFK